jgi:hypothetical protein
LRAAAPSPRRSAVPPWIASCIPVPVRWCPNRDRGWFPRNDRAGTGSGRPTGGPRYVPVRVRARRFRPSACGQGG